MKPIGSPETSVLNSLTSLITHKTEELGMLLLEQGGIGGGYARDKWRAVVNAVMNRRVS